MEEPQVDLNEPIKELEEPKPRSIGALILFLVFALPMPV